MCRFIETIQIGAGEASNLFYHDRRMNETRSHFWPGCPIIHLTDSIYPSPSMNQIKCRVVYGEAGIEEISYTPYVMREVRSLQLVFSETIGYEYKSVDREGLNHLFASRGLRDDVLIVKNGLLTDTSIANIALFDGIDWYTPSCPLLKGIKRMELLEKGIMKEKEIKCEDLSSFSSVRLFNAMIQWGALELPIDRIYD